jgi:hypothetical protein
MGKAKDLSAALRRRCIMDETGIDIFIFNFGKQIENRARNFADKVELIYGNSHSCRYS